MRAIVIGTALALLVGATAFAAGSKCDQGVVKAVGKKASCECGANAKASKKGGAPDYSKCTSKFSGSCSKAQSAGDCAQQGGPCATKETAVDTFVAANCGASPSGAFLE